MPFLYVPYTFLYVPLDSWALLSPSSIILPIWPISPKWPSPLRSYTFRYTFLYVPGGLSTFLLLAELLVNKHALRKYSLRGSNPRPMAHKTIALTTELREPSPAAPSPPEPSRFSLLRHEGTRSYTCGIHTNDVPASNLQICVQKSYVPIRSVPYLSQFTQIVSQSYTFLYVRLTF